MRNIILIFKNSIVRNKTMMVIAVISAVLMCAIFQLNVNMADENYALQQISVGLSDNDGETAEGLKKYFEDSLGMEILEDNYENLSKLLIDRKISAIIEVPQGFYGSAAEGEIKPLVFTTLGDYENAAFIEAYLNSYMRGLSVISRAAGGDRQLFSDMLSSQELPHDVSVSESGRKSDIRTAVNRIFKSVAGFIMSITCAVTLFISRQILDDRELGTFNRMKCSSVKPLEYVMGVSLFAAVCVTLTNLIYIVYVYNSGSVPEISMGLAFGSTELLLLFTIGLSVMLGLLINSANTLMTIAMSYAVIGSMLGGAWFPIHDDLGFVSNLAKLFPQYWYMDLISGSMADEGFDILPNLLIIGLAAVLTCLISAAIFTRKNNSNE